MTVRHADELDVLLLEDNPGDVRLIQEAFAESDVDSDLTVATDGEAALDHLHDPADGSAPDLLILDLNVPRVGGSEVLAEVRATPALASIPVVVLSSSDSSDDVEQTYELDADGYLVKPVDPTEFISLVRTSVESFADAGRLPLGEYAACSE